LHIRDTHSSKIWSVGFIERDGTVFWSSDSKRIFLEDLYAADDAKVRVFDVSGPVPREIRGLDQIIRKEIYAHIPKAESTLWLVYPQTCFAANDSSRIVVVADAPHVPDEANVPATPLKLRLTVSLTTLHILEIVTVGSSKLLSSSRKDN
jgi:hypothetical protein